MCQSPAGVPQWEKGLEDAGKATAMSTPWSFSCPGWEVQALPLILHMRDPWAFPSLAALPALSPLAC